MTEIRAAISTDARRIAEVHVQSWRETYKNIINDNFLANLSIDQRAAM